jgi:hypothetical protein
MLQQIGASDKLPDASHPKLLENLDKLDIPGMIHIGQALRCPIFAKQVRQLRVC